MTTTTCSFTNCLYCGQTILASTWEPYSRHEICVNCANDVIASSEYEDYRYEQYELLEEEGEER